MENAIGKTYRYGTATGLTSVISSTIAFINNTRTVGWPGLFVGRFPGDGDRAGSSAADASRGAGCQFQQGIADA